MFYNIKFKPSKNLTAASKYKYKKYKKGKVYTIRRKLTPSGARILMRRKFPDHKILSVRRIKRRRK